MFESGTLLKNNIKIKKRTHCLDKTVKKNFINIISTFLAQNQTKNFLRVLI